MSRSYDDYDYEYDYEPQRPVRVVKKGGVLGKILFFFVGLILGIVLIVGSVIGVGYHILKSPTKDTVKTAEKFVGGDLYSLFFGSVQQEGDKTIIKTGLFDEKYAEETLATLLGDSVQALGAFANNGTLNDLNNVSPSVGKAVEVLLRKTDELSIPISKDTLLATPVNELSNYITTCAKETAVGDLIKGSGQTLSPALMALSYGEENVDYVVDTDGNVTMLKGEKTLLKDLMEEDMSPVLKRVPVDAVIKIDPLNEKDAVMCALAYGPETRYEVVGNKVQMKQVYYVYEDKGDGPALYDDQDEPLQLVEAPTLLTEEAVTSVIKIVFLTGETNEDGSFVSETQYLTFDPTTGNLLAFADQACQIPVLYRKTSFGDLQEDSNAIIDNVSLADALDVKPDTSHKILMSLAYGKQGEDYVIENGEVVLLGDAKPHTIGELRKENSNLINSIQLCDIMDEDQDESLVMFLLYGRKDVHYKIVNGVVEMQQKFIAIRGTGNAIKVYNEYGEELEKQDVANDIPGWELDTAEKTYTDANGNVYTYVMDSEGRKITTNDKNEAYVCYLEQDGEAVKFEKTTLGDMSGNDNIISKLTTRIKIREIMNEEDIYENKFLKHVADETLETLPGALDELTIQEVYEEEVYDDDGNLESEWWYLLINEDGEEGTYTIKQMDELMENMKRNIHDATLQKLSDDGIIKFSGATLNSELVTEVRYGSGEGEYHTVYVYTKDTDLDGDIDHYDERQPINEVFKNADGTPKTHVGHLTVEEMIYYVDGLLVVIDMLGN